MPSSRTISANGIEIFLREQGEGPLVVAEVAFQRDVGLTMCTLLGRGFSDPAASLFVEAGKEF